MSQPNTEGAITTIIAVLFFLSCFVFAVVYKSPDHQAPRAIQSIPKTK